MEWSEVCVLIAKSWGPNHSSEDLEAFMEEVCGISGWTLPEIRAQQEADRKAFQDEVAVRYEDLVEIGLNCFLEKYT